MKIKTGRFDGLGNISPPERWGFEKYPPEPFFMFTLPVRCIDGKYQVWTGKRWYKLDLVNYVEFEEKIHGRKT